MIEVVWPPAPRSGSFLLRDLLEKLSEGETSVAHTQILHRDLRAGMKTEESENRLLLDHEGFLNFQDSAGTAEDSKWGWEEHYICVCGNGSGQLRSFWRLCWLCSVMVRSASHVAHHSSWGEVKPRGWTPFCRLDPFWKGLMDLEGLLMFQLRWAFLWKWLWHPYGFWRVQAEDVHLSWG